MLRVGRRLAIGIHALIVALLLKVAAPNGGNAGIDQVSLSHRLIKITGVCQTRLTVCVFVMAMRFTK